MTHTLHPFGTPGTWPLRLKKGAAASVLGLCCAFGPLPLALAQPDAPASGHVFNIPPQPLAGALIAFGLQSGKQVSVDPQLLKGVSSPGVNGDMSNDAALAYLLQGTGIGWGYQDGALVFHRPPNAAAGEPLMLDSTVVLGFTQENSFQGATVIDQKAIQAFPGAKATSPRCCKCTPACSSAVRSRVPRPPEKSTRRTSASTVPSSTRTTS